MARTGVWSWAALAGLAVPLALGSVSAHAATTAKPYDFDGDGRPELVVGAPGLEVGGHPGAGGVAVVPSSSPYDGRVVTQSTAKVVGASEDGDAFGSAVVSADFDRDGYADLVVGQPGENLTKSDGAGAVTILYGTAKGLTGTRSKQVSEPTGTYEYAAFGAALAVGDLNGDGYPDLAIGAPADQATDRSTEDNPASGTVTVLFGSRTGLQTSGSRQVHGVRGTDGRQDDGFGSAIAVTDVDADGRADLVVTAQGSDDDDDGSEFPGSVAYCAGSTGGPTGCRRLARSDDLGGLAAVVTGNVQGDGRPEIVVGVPTSSIINDAGHLEVLALSGAGDQTSARAVFRNQRDLGVAGYSTPDEQPVDDFGAALAIGRVDGDGYDDLVVGAPNEPVGDERAGRVVLVHGGSGGLATSGNRAYDQDTPGVPGGSEAGDRFGSAVTLVDRNGDGRPDLTIGAAGEDDENGRVTTLLGTGTGFTTTGADAYGLAELHVGQRFEAQLGAAIGR
ncbi:MAG TPA: FG-GAP-like repeat-containing protein [Friedmanniella sp.]